jgi:hypothetical protein
MSKSLSERLDPEAIVREMLEQDDLDPVDRDRLQRLVGGREATPEETLAEHERFEEQFEQWLSRMEEASV